MYSNQQPSIYTTRQYTYDSQLNAKNTRTLPFNQTEGIQPSTYYSNDRSNFASTMNHQSPNTTRYSATNNPSRGAIEKTNMMSSENPFHDPARSYEQLNTPRTRSSIVSPPRNTSGMNKTLNLSDENPFHAIYGGYHYPSQIDPSKRITNQSATIRSTENKSLNLSDENPFYSTYGRYHYSGQNDPQKRITEIPKSSVPLIPTKALSDTNPFNNYRPSLIREYSAGNHGNGSNSFSSSIADWERTHPAPLSYRPIQVQRPPPEYYSQSELANVSSYIPPLSPPRQQRQLSPVLPPPAPRIQSQSQKPNSTAPLDKTSLNMSPDNPFADTYGRYYYPSTEEIKIQKRTNERSTRIIDQPPVNNNRIIQSTNQMGEYPETEKKDVNTDKK